MTQVAMKLQDYFKAEPTDGRTFCRVDKDGNSSATKNIEVPLTYFAFCIYISPLLSSDPNECSYEGFWLASAKDIWHALYYQEQV